MKAVIQRVSSASVTIDGKNINKIRLGYLILLGIETNDQQADLNYIVKKTIGLRIFNDQKGHMNLSIQDINGEILVVSQFTLCANTKKGRRPSFINAAPSKQALIIYQQYCKQLTLQNLHVKTGKFGSNMQIELINDGPVTIILDSNDKA